MSEQQIAIWLGVAFVAIIVAFGIAKGIWERRNRATAIAELRRNEIARIEERSEFTWGGAAAVLALVAFNGLAVIGYLASNTVLHQTVALLGSISASVFWGVFVIIGRKRTYTVYRVDPPMDLNIE